MGTRGTRYSLALDIRSTFPIISRRHIMFYPKLIIYMENIGNGDLISRTHVSLRRKYFRSQDSFALPNFEAWFSDLLAASYFVFKSSDLEFSFQIFHYVRSMYLLVVFVILMSLVDCFNFGSFFWRIFSVFVKIVGECSGSCLDFGAGAFMVICY